MSQRKTVESKSRQPDAAGRKRSGGRSSQAAPSSTSSWFTTSAIRETVESIVIAFVLAFLFRTFEAEAFVIPTGSMAPTLMGRHKDLQCPKCGYEYQVSASSEVDQNGIAKPNSHVESGTCPMCRFTADLGQDNPQHKDYPPYSGDRILVTKFIYQFHEPRRWDVIVFKYPDDPTTNYIKRLTGLPGEKIIIHRGNLWIENRDGTKAIARKDSPRKLLAMLQPVFDNDFAPKIVASGLPARWQQDPAGTAAGEWTSPDGKSFQTDGSGTGETWIRYQHRVPSYAQWQKIVGDVRERGAVPGQLNVPSQLISDFYAYNTGNPKHGAWTDPGLGPAPDPSSLGLHWVGDIAVDCSVESRSDSGLVVLELVRGGRRFQCRINLADGKATLGISGAGAEMFQPAGPTAVIGRGAHHVVFANVDDQVRLLVDGSEVAFDAPTTYDSESLGTHIPQAADLSPVGVAVKGAALQVSHLKVLRDIYYIADKQAGSADRALIGQFLARGDQRPPLTDYRHDIPDLSNPAHWETAFGDDNMNTIGFQLAAPDPKHPDGDQFLVLGDNSPQSKDSRLWGERYWVARQMLIGEALFIYWPHSWNRVPGTPIPFPFFPNFSRMHLVR
jgi:signal peptidase I